MDRTIAVRRAAAGAIAFLALAAPCGAQVHDGRTIVRARLITDADPVNAVRPFRVGVQLTVAPGWHVYWENPGDTALPIEVAWTLPSGFTASPLRWPAPTRYSEGGEITVYGYERETVLLTTITPPAGPMPQAAAIHAAVKWLVCEKVCLPGEAQLDQRIPADRASAQRARSVLDAFEKSVPLPEASSPIAARSATASKSADGSWQFTIALEGSGAAAQAFYPRVVKGVTLRHSSVSIRDGAITLIGDPDDDQPRPTVIGGVLVTDRGAFEVEAPIEPGVSQGAGASSDRSTAKSADTSWVERLGHDGGRSSLPLGLVVLFACAGGMLLNLMPCVLPVLSLKIMGFVRQAGTSASRGRLLGTAFGAGVLVSFWIFAGLVIVLRAAGRQIGWGFQFQSPAFLVVMAAVVLLFALVQLGLFDVNGPAISTGGLPDAGLHGAFLHGVLATVLATPCTAPFLGTALGVAFIQPARVVVLIFTAAGVGLAAPYVVLSWNPGWLRWMPKPGAWMIRVKQGMAFLLLATLVWLLSVLGSQTGTDAMTWTLVFLLLIAFCAWAIAQQEPRRTPVGRRVAAWLVSGALVSGGCYGIFVRELAWGTTGHADDRVAIRRSADWAPFALADLRSRVDRGETVFIDFTADWCWSCKVNERTVLRSTRVEESFRRLRITRIKADWTHRNPEITRLLARFGRAGVPFYIVFPAGRLQAPIALSEVITPGSVVDALERAGASTSPADLQSSGL